MLTPYYYKPQMTAEVLRRHFVAVAEASPVPVYLYSMTLFTGVPWPPGLAADLASHPRIVGMKESSSDLGLLGRIIDSVPAALRSRLRVRARALSRAVPGRVRGHARRRELRARAGGGDLPRIRGG